MDFTNILEILPTLTDFQMKVIYHRMGELQRQRDEEKKNTPVNQLKAAYLALQKRDITRY